MLGTVSGTRTAHRYIIPVNVQGNWADNAFKQHFKGNCLMTPAAVVSNIPVPSGWSVYNLCTPSHFLNDKKKKRRLSARFRIKLEGLLETKSLRHSDSFHLSSTLGTKQTSDMTGSITNSGPDSSSTNHSVSKELKVNNGHTGVKTVTKEAAQRFLKLSEVKGPAAAPAAGRWCPNSEGRTQSGCGRWDAETVQASGLVLSPRQRNLLAPLAVPCVVWIWTPW